MRPGNLQKIVDFMLVDLHTAVLGCKVQSIPTAMQNYRRTVSCVSMSIAPRGLAKPTSVGCPQRYHAWGFVHML